IARGFDNHVGSHHHHEVFVDDSRFYGWRVGVVGRQEIDAGVERITIAYGNRFSLCPFLYIQPISTGIAFWNPDTCGRADLYLPPPHIRRTSWTIHDVEREIHINRQTWMFIKWAVESIQRRETGSDFYAVANVNARGRRVRAIGVAEADV